MIYTWVFADIRIYVLVMFIFKTFSCNLLSFSFLHYATFTSAAPTHILRWSISHIWFIFWCFHRFLITQAPSDVYHFRLLSTFMDLLCASQNLACACMMIYMEKYLERPLTNESILFDSLSTSQRDWSSYVTWFLG